MNRVDIKAAPLGPNASSGADPRIAELEAQIRQSCQGRNDHVAACFIAAAHALDIIARARQGRERGMLDEGIYLAPSAFEAGFVSAAHGEKEIEKTIVAARKVFAKLTS